MRVSIVSILSMVDDSIDNGNDVIAVQQVFLWFHLSFEHFIVISMFDKRLDCVFLVFIRIGLSVVIKYFDYLNLF